MKRTYLMLEPAAGGFFLVLPIGNTNSLHFYDLTRFFYDHKKNQNLEFLFHKKNHKKNQIASRFGKTIKKIRRIIKKIENRSLFLIFFMILLIFFMKKVLKKNTGSTPRPCLATGVARA